MTRPIRIAVLVFDGVDDLDALAPLRILRSGAALGAPFEVSLVALNADASSSIRTSSEVQVIPDSPLTSQVDWLIVPGGGWASRAAEGAWAEFQKGTLPEAIRQMADLGVKMASVCTGAMLLAKAGLVSNRAMTTHASAIENLRGFGANIVHARVVDDGNLISCGGVTSGIDLAIWLIERFAGTELALKMESNLEYERRGTVWRQP